MSIEWFYIEIIYLENSQNCKQKKQKKKPLSILVHETDHKVNPSSNVIIKTELIYHHLFLNVMCTMLILSISKVHASFRVINDLSNCKLCSCHV